MEPSIPCEAADFVDLSRDVLGRDAVLRFRVGGNSMRPFITDGDVVNVVPCAANDLAVGDVVLFHTKEGALLAHRLVGVSAGKEGRGEFATKGDAAGRWDATIGAEQVVGKVVRVRRPDGKEKAIDRGLYRFAGRMMGRYPGLVQRLRPLLRVARSVLATDHRESTGGLPGQDQ